MISDKKAEELADLIYKAVANRRWLYWPIGPMTSQVFDREQCKKDIKEWIKKNDS